MKISTLTLIKRLLVKHSTGLPGCQGNGREMSVVMSSGSNELVFANAFIDRQRIELYRVYDLERIASHQM